MVFTAHMSTAQVALDDHNPSGLRHNKARILILNSYHQGYNWSDSIMQGVFSELDDINSYELFVEFMDTKRYSDSTYYELLKNVYLYKYKNLDIDVILSCDDNALNFLLQYRDRIFSKVPVSFCGINDFHPYILEGKELYTGVCETYNVVANLKLIERLHPNVNHVVVVADVTKTGQDMIAMMKREEGKFKDKLHIDYLINKEPEEMKTYLNRLDDDTVVIWGIYLRLPDGNFISSEESISLITSYTSRPVYCIWDVVGLGVVGGNITTPSFQGAEAARIVKRILKGENVSDIEIKESPMLYKFDYNLLKKFNIPLDAIPEGSVIINKPASFWQEHKRLAITLLSVFASLITVVFALGYLYRKSKRVQFEIKSKNAKLLQIRSKLLRTNRKLEKSKKRAEESVRLKTAFLANLSHEIRTPMNGIIGFTSILQESNLNEEEQKLYLDIINTSGQRMVRLIDDLVNISKIESGTVELHYSEINLIPFFNEINFFFSKEAIDRSLSLEFVHELDDLVIVSDRNKLEQIFYNLIKNALKYTRKGYVKFGYVRRNELVEFFVEDTGIGVPIEARKSIFDRFHQVSNGDSTKGGIGLGLSIVKEFVEMLGGKIQFASEVNEGSRFYFNLPLDKG